MLETCIPTLSPITMAHCDRNAATRQDRFFSFQHIRMFNDQEKRNRNRRPKSEKESGIRIRRVSAPK